MDDYPSSTNHTYDSSSYSVPSAPPQLQPSSSYPMNIPSHFDHGPRPSHPSHALNSHSPGEWSSGLCGCFQDCSSCCLTCCCPCVAFGRIAEIVDRGSTSCGVSGALYALLLFATGCSCMYSCFYRSKIRGQYFLEESPCTDCCVHCCCEGCALCQEYRELKKLGFDMSIGWHGNMERQKNRSITVPPTVHTRMGR